MGIIWNYEQHFGHCSKLQVISFLMRGHVLRMREKKEKNILNENSKKTVIWLWLCLSCTQRLIYWVSSEMNWSVEEAIRNKQLVGQTAHVFNLLLSTRPAVVKQNYNGPFNWYGKTEMDDECVTDHKSMSVLGKMTKVIGSLRCYVIMCWMCMLTWQTMLVLVLKGRLGIITLSSFQIRDL